MSNTLHRFILLLKFCADCHFIYITTCGDENKEELQSYYKFTEEDMEEITKEWPIEFILLVGYAEFFDPNLIGSPAVTRTEWDGPSKAKNKKKKE
jgi:hypothetical protein